MQQANDCHSSLQKQGATFQACLMINIEGLKIFQGLKDNGFILSSILLGKHSNNVYLKCIKISQNTAQA